MMNENVLKVLNENMWDLATMSNEPNAVPVAFKSVSKDGKLLVGDVFLATTLKNIAENGKIAVSCFNAQTLEGYQIKGKAEFKKAVEAMFKGARTAKGALIITPEKVIVTTPGADNKKEL